MAEASSKRNYLLEPEHLNRLISLLREDGYDVIAPVEREGAIHYDPVVGISDLPKGIVDEQNGGHYRLKKGEGGGFFDYVVGPQSWKRHLHPPEAVLWRSVRKENSFTRIEEEGTQPRFAFLGVRGCEMAAIEIQDQVFMGGEYKDFIYSQRREGAFLIAVNCTRAGGTCFCSSMGTGPAVREGYDISLTEVHDDGSHYFTALSGSERGEEFLGKLGADVAGAERVQHARQLVEKAASSMGRSLNRETAKDLLQSNYESRQWDEVAKRCLSCGNCTMVCPTCFCTTVEDVTDLSGDSAERVRKWDSCFTTDFSYIHGGNVRFSSASRYRHWISHKLANWVDQFGATGCVGCGRCITWCPVGIDITEEMRTLESSGGRV